MKTLTLTLALTLALGLTRAVEEHVLIAA